MHVRADLSIRLLSLILCIIEMGWDNYDTRSGKAIRRNEETALMMSRKASTSKEHVV
jgi:hypothetical protein